LQPSRLRSEVGTWQIDLQAAEISDEFPSKVSEIGAEAVTRRSILTNVEFEPASKLRDIEQQCFTGLRIGSHSGDTVSPQASPGALLCINFQILTIEESTILK
jgi:hypothetical protein